jgi:hypothetical protein
MQAPAGPQFAHQAKSKIDLILISDGGTMSNDIEKMTQKKPGGYAGRSKAG